MVLEKTVESPLDCKEIQPVHPKGDQSWVFIRRTDVEAETPIHWPPDAKSWLIWKDPDAAKDWGWDRRMASPTQWTWVWVAYGSWWWLGRPGVLRFMGSQSQTQLSDWTELNHNQLMKSPNCKYLKIHASILFQICIAIWNTNKVFLSRYPAIFGFDKYTRYTCNNQHSPAHKTHVSLSLFQWKEEKKKKSDLRKDKPDIWLNPSPASIIILIDFI